MLVSVLLRDLLKQRLMRLGLFLVYTLHTLSLLKNALQYRVTSPQEGQGFSLAGGPVRQIPVSSIHRDPLNSFYAHSIQVYLYRE